MASKNNKKKPVTSTNFATLTPKQYIKLRARKLPIVKAYINIDFREVGFACCLIARQQGGGKYLIGVYMVDVFCLGVKNSSMKMGLTEQEFQDFIVEYYTSMDMPYKEYDPNYAQNVIWGAFEYAEELGFAPTKYSDFDLTQYILDPIDEIEFVEIPFGQDGKPFYIAGPHDNVQKIRNILTKKMGADGYHYLHSVGDNGGDFWAHNEEEDYDFDPYFDNNFEIDFDADDNESETYDDYEEIK